RAKRVWVQGRQRVIERRSAHVEFDSDVLAPRAARRFISTLLREWAVAEDVIERGALLVSELVSNAVLHGTGSIRMEVSEHEAASTSRVRIEVCNEGLGRPTLRVVDRGDVSGRGLRLIDELADDWGSTSADGQTSVWFALHRADAERRSN
ncbi:MAG: ATP-binding protein, partial [Ilumatobacteraceae bacterium]